MEGKNGETCCFPQLRFFLSKGVFSEELGAFFDECAGFFLKENGGLSVEKIVIVVALVPNN